MQKISVRFVRNFLLISHSLTLTLYEFSNMSLKANIVYWSLRPSDSRIVYMESFRNLIWSLL